MNWPGNNDDIVLGTIDGAFPLLGQFSLSPPEQEYHATIWGQIRLR